MRVINFDLNLSEDELEQKAWANALEKWYIIFSSGRAAWPQGYDLNHAIDSHDAPSLRKVFGNRSASTVLKRGNSIVKFLRWDRRARFSICPFPVAEADVEEYLSFLSHIGAGPLGMSGFLEATRFC